MSMENELSKIAKSLTEIVSLLKNSNAANEATIVDPQIVGGSNPDLGFLPGAGAGPGESEVPGQESTPPVGEDMFAGAEQAAITTPAGLRELAQKAVVACGTAEGEKAQLMVAFIKNEICIKLSPKDPKLVKIPAAKIPEAVKGLRAYAEKLGINLN